MEKILKNFTLEFLGKGKHKITPEKFLKLENGVFLDVRTKEEFETISFNFKHHKNIKSINIPLNELPDRIDELSKEESISIWCPGNFRSAIAYSYLLSKDYMNVYILMGGFSELTNSLKPGGIFKVIDK